MTTYKEIFGKYVKNYSSDPSSDIEGQIWYNSTSGTFKSQVILAAAWASGGSLPATRAEMGGAGTQTAGLGFGGFNSPPFTTYADTYKYDGTSWTATGNMVNGRMQMASAGTQTAAFGAGGYAQPVGRTEKFDGTSWTSSGNLNTNRRLIAGSGTQTAGLALGGFAPGASTAAEAYDGTSWTNITSLPAASNSGSAFGTQTASLYTAASGPAFPDSSSIFWNGSTWTTGGSLNTGRASAGSSGINTAGIIFGGTPSGTFTELYNGTSFSTSGNMSTGRHNIGGARSAPNSAALGFGGYSYPGSFKNNTEEFTGAVTSTKTVTVS